MNAQTRDAARLQDLTSAFYDGRSSREEAHSAFIDLVLERIGCSRVCLWKFEGDGDALSLCCFAAKAAGKELEISGRRLHLAEYRDYFNALIARGVFVSVDVMHDPTLAAMRTSYLQRISLLSSLDAAFMLNGRAFGTVCCEQTDRIRHWRAGDVSTLRSIVNRLTVLMAASPRSMLWNTPTLPLRALPPIPQAQAPTERRAHPAARKHDKRKHDKHEHH